MSIETEVQTRSESKCELCTATDNLSVYEVPSSPDTSADTSVYVCETCKMQMDNPDTVEANHWRCLNDSMWSQVPAVQVLTWRMLTRLRGEGWPQDLLDMMYLEDDVRAWAEAAGEGEAEEDAVIHRDSNGVVLEAGDTVVLIKDLKVKGSSFIAKQGTAVRNIRLDKNNAEHIEGKVNSQTIVILTQFTKKS
ncbi:MAG: PhnA domain-containing protein [Ghiorsea sp.]